LKGVSESTSKVLDILMKYPELDSYNLIGGTGVAIRMNHRG